MNRLRRSIEFRSIRESPHRYHSPFFLAQWDCKEEENSFSFGIIVTKKIGVAVKRNFIKRRLREAVRIVFLQNPPSCRLVLVARHGSKVVSFSDLIQTLTQLRGIILKTISKTN